MLENIDEKQATDNGYSIRLTGEVYRVNKNRDSKVYPVVNTRIREKDAVPPGGCIGVLWFYYE